MRKFLINISTANSCLLNIVIAPSRSKTKIELKNISFKWEHRLLLRATLSALTSFWQIEVRISRDKVERLHLTLVLLCSITEAQFSVVIWLHYYCLLIFFVCFSFVLCLEHPQKWAEIFSFIKIIRSSVDGYRANRQSALSFQRQLTQHSQKIQKIV